MNFLWLLKKKKKTNKLDLQMIIWTPVVLWEQTYIQTDSSQKFNILPEFPEFLLCVEAILLSAEKWQLKNGKETVRQKLLQAEPKINIKIKKHGNQKRCKLKK